MYSSNDDQSNKVTASSTIAIEENASEQTTSVHLKLTQQFNCSLVSTNITEEKLKPIFEYVKVNDNSSVLTFIGTDKRSLELFGLHMFNRNLSEDSYYYIREVISNLHYTNNI
jgi:hypothetical protein